AGRDMPRADIHPQDARAAYEAGRKDREAASKAPKAPQTAAGDGPAATDGNARPAPASAPSLSTELVLRSDGTPFKTEKAARQAMKNRRLQGYEPVEVDGGWALRQAPASDAGKADPFADNK